MADASSKFFAHPDWSGSSLPLVDFGLQPVSNRFLPAESSEFAPCFPLALRINPSNGLIHLAVPFPISELVPRYSCLTCFEPEGHLDKLAERLGSLHGINRDSVFGAFSFKDDTTLSRLEKLGYLKTWRLDPVEDLCVTDPLASVETYQAHFTPDRAQHICERRGAVDVFIVRHVMEHFYDLSSLLDSCKILVRPGGYVVFEVPDCTRAFELADYTTIWEEHVFYFTPYTLSNVLEREGFRIHHFESFEYPFENSLVTIATTACSGQLNRDNAIVKQELARAEKFAAGFEFRQNQVRECLTRARQKYGPIAMFGAGHLSVAFLSLMEVTDLVEFVIDDNPNKKGMRMPLGNLSILGSHSLYERGIRVCLLSLNPQNQPKVIASHSAFTEAGGRFASIFSGGDLPLEHAL